MNVKIKSIKVGNGDCFFLCLREGAQTFSIMIDCKSYNNDTKIMVEDILNKHINLLVITHIDNDHISGVTKMLNSVDDLVVDEIWFNCYQREPEMPAQELSDYEKKRLIELKGNLPIVADMVNSDVNSTDAKLLSEAILQYEKSINKNVWRREYLTTDHDDIQLGKNGEWGTIHFISPTKAALNSLDKEFRKMFRNLFFQKYEFPLTEDISIYELMIQYLKQKQRLSEPMIKIDSLPVFNEKYFCEEVNTEENEMRIENIASIAFVWSYASHKVLFAGDASHLQLSYQIKKDYKNELPLILDAIKVSHHGSNTGTSMDLMNLIDSGEYFISCGTKKVPSLPTLAKIITRELPKSINCRNIHYNKDTEKIKYLRVNSDKLTNLPKFELKDGNEYEFTC